MPERQKQPKTNALTKVEGFLNSVYLKIARGESFSLDEEARSFKLSGSFATIIKRQKIVDAIGNRKDKTWQWAYPKPPDKALALVLMDELNRYNKNWTDAPAIADNQPKSLFDPVASISEEVYLAGCIASSVYKDIDFTAGTLGNADKEYLQSANDNIIFATQDLLNKIYKRKTQKNEQPTNQ